MRKIIYIIAAALCLGSCVYPYDDFVVTEVDNLVVEGDIVVGGLSYFLPTRLLSLSEGSKYQFVYSTVWVESGVGDKYPAEFLDTSYGYVADLSSADPSKEYRLRVDTEDGKQYASQWGQVEGMVTVDEIKYQLDSAGGEMKLQVGLHSDGSSRHFRYRYFEDWEYHAYTMAYVFYDPVKDTLRPYDGSFNTYFCWQTSMSRGLNLATTEKMLEDKLEDYTFKTIQATDERLSVMYKITLDVYPVSAASYAYYENVRDISSPTGDLFSPIPSEVRGNIRNMNDDSEMVYGLIAVVRPSTAILYYDNEAEQFYRNIKKVGYEEVAVPESEFSNYYKKKWLPARQDPFEGVMWGRADCLDCRLSGGTKNRPEGWPTGAN